MSEITPSRAAVLELGEERRAMREGYEFLDEKRLLLAAEMLRELRAWEAAWKEFTATLAAATAALRAAVARHGLEGLEVYPAARLAAAEFRIATRRLLGVRLQEAILDPGETNPAPASAPSPEAGHCRALFGRLLAQAAALAAHAGNLERLRGEYRRTERRARALEDVLLPEIDQTLAELESRLEETEQEEAVRVRQA